MATDHSEGDGPQVTPIENRAFFAIEEDEGYVRIEQSVGNQALYTPEEARDVAEAIQSAADDAAGETSHEGGTGGESATEE